VTGSVDERALDDGMTVAELSAVISALQELSAEELVAGGIHVEGTWDEVDDPVLLRDGLPVETWREGYPYDERMSRGEYDETKRLLQIELLKAQHWLLDAGGTLVVLFEGRDAAGTGSTMKRSMEHLTPRSARVVALSAPTPRERGQWYLHSTTDRRKASLSPREQLTRFTIRRIDPVRQWKLSPMDLASLNRWDEYTGANEAMFEWTHSAHAPWTIVRSNDKKRGRVEALRHVLHQLDYPDKDVVVVGRPDPSIVGPSWSMARDVGERPAS
jgi:polyphosphate kinase 2 (PPK2 family)